VKQLFEILRSTLHGEVLRNEPMARHTTWRVGGPADLFIVPAERDDAVRALEILGAAGIPWLPLGTGSNLLVRDGGIRGAVIHTGRLREVSFDLERCRANAEAGLSLTRFISLAAERGLGGLEELAGIPGTVGGAVAMNAGAGNQDLSQVVRSVRLAGPDGMHERGAEKFSWAYRSSGLDGTELVLNVDFHLRPGDPQELGAILQRRVEYRRAAQGVGKPNGGSVFKNPAGSQAWRLIDAAGLRGAASGGARISVKHANFIVNENRASAADILALMETIRDRVRQASGVELEPEVRIVGEG